MKQPSIPSELCDEIAALVEDRSGLRFAGARRAELQSKVAHTFAASGCPSLDDWLRRLRRRDDTQIEGLIQSLTVGETYFFRHRPYFDAIERQVLPQVLAERQTARQLRVWCAGCATGEEAYSLAILLRRSVPSFATPYGSILATDLNRSFLARAEFGIYGDWSFREADESFKTAYFTREDQRYRIRPEIRRMVHFAQLNLVSDAYPSPATRTTALDLILCRNVLIYFAPELSARIVKQFHAALRPGGWLVLGPSDPLPGLLHNFDVHQLSGAMLYQRPVNNPAAGTSVARGRPFVPGPAAEPPRLAPHPDCAHRVVTEAGVRSPDDATPEAGAVESGEADWRAALAAARQSADRGQLREAEQHCRGAIDQAGLQPEPYYLLGTIRDAQGDIAGARTAFRQALYVDRGFVPAHLALAACHRHLGRADLAHKALSQARRLIDGRADDEVILTSGGMTVGRLRDALESSTGDERRPEGS